MLLSAHSVVFSVGWNGGFISQWKLCSHSTALSQLLQSQTLGKPTHAQTPFFTLYTCIHCIRWCAHICFSLHLYQRIEMLLEMSFFIASHGNLEEAYDCLSSQLQVNPFRSHSLCHGYCAVYQYLMHKKSEKKATEVQKSTMWLS